MLRGGRTHQDSFVPKPPYEVTQRSPLHTAIRDGQLALARHLIKEGVDVRATDSEGQTPLHYAAARDSMTLIETLLQAGADPFLRDHMGDTALNTAALNGRSGSAVLLARTAAETPEKLRLWPNPQDVKDVLNAAKPTPGGTPYVDVDRLVERLTGSHRDLNTYSEIFKYEGHLLDLDDKLFGVKAEGWNHVSFLYQRLRSAVAMWIKPAPLPPPAAAHFNRRELRDVLEQEIVGLLASLNTVRHFYSLEDLSKDARHAVSAHEAAIIAQRVLGLAPHQEFTIPLGLPTHAIYCSLRPTQVDGTDVVVLRIDNRGWGYKRGHDEDPSGKVSPFRLNIPRAYIESPEGAARLRQTLEQLVGYMHDDDVDIGMVYAQLVSLERDLHARFERSVIDAQFDPSEQYWKVPQSVGNCSLKNHNAAVWSHLASAARARLGPTASSEEVHAVADSLWGWFHDQEVELILDRMWNFVVTPKSVLHLEHEKRGKELKELLQDADSRANKLVAFLTQPRCANVGSTLTGETLAAVVRSGDLRTMQLLLAHGVDLHSDKQRCHEGESLLHIAVRSENADAAAMVALLVKAGAPVDELNAHGLTPMALALQQGKTAAMLALLQSGSQGETGTVDAEAALRQQLATTERALRELQLRRAALSVVPAAPVALTPIALNIAEAVLPPTSSLTPVAVHTAEPVLSDASGAIAA